MTNLAKIHIQIDISFDFQIYIILENNLDRQIDNKIARYIERHISRWLARYLDSYFFIVLDRDNSRKDSRQIDRMITRQKDIFLDGQARYLDGFGKRLFIPINLTPIIPGSRRYKLLEIEKTQIFCLYYKPLKTLIFSKLIKFEDF